MGQGTGSTKLNAAVAPQFTARRTASRVLGLVRALASVTVVLLVSVAMQPARAADAYQTGTIIDITSGQSGLLIRLDVGPPTNCGSTPYGWMQIPETNKTMLATALMMWYSGQRAGTVYTNPNTPNGLCVVNQLDPA